MHLPNFCEALGVELITQTEKEMEFDMIGIEEETDAYEFWRIVKEEVKYFDSVVTLFSNFEF